MAKFPLIKKFTKGRFLKKNFMGSVKFSLGEITHSDFRTKAVKENFHKVLLRKYFARRYAENDEYGMNGSICILIF